MNDFECPYCGAEQQDNGESDETGHTYEQECCACGKSFAYVVDYIKTYETFQAPCMNGEEHSLKPIITTYHPAGFIRHRCEWCDLEVQVPVDQAAKGEK